MMASLTCQVPMNIMQISSCALDKVVCARYSRTGLLFQTGDPESDTVTSFTKQYSLELSALVESYALC